MKVMTVYMERRVMRRRTAEGAFTCCSEDAAGSRVCMRIQETAVRSWIRKDVRSGSGV